MNYYKKGEIVTALTIAGIVILTIITFVSNNLLSKNKQTTKTLATIQCKDSNGNPGQSCDSPGKCDIQGGCNPACCGSDGDCTGGQTCGTGIGANNGFCESTKSCDPNSGSNPTQPPNPTSPPSQCNPNDCNGWRCPGPNCDKCNKSPWYWWSTGCSGLPSATGCCTPCGDKNLICQNPGVGNCGNDGCIHGAAPTNTPVPNKPSNTPVPNVSTTPSTECTSPNGTKFSTTICENNTYFNATFTCNNGQPKLKQVCQGNCNISNTDCEQSGVTNTPAPGITNTPAATSIPPHAQCPNNTDHSYSCTVNCDNKAGYYLDRNYECYGPFGNRTQDLCCHYLGTSPTPSPVPTFAYQHCPNENPDPNINYYYSCSTFCGPGWTSAPQYKCRSFWDVCCVRSDYQTPTPKLNSSSFIAPSDTVVAGTEVISLGATKCLMVGEGYCLQVNGL